MLLYCLKCRKNAESKNPKVEKNKERKNNAHSCKHTENHEVF